MRESWDPSWGSWDPKWVCGIPGGIVGIPGRNGGIPGGKKGAPIWDSISGVVIIMGGLGKIQGRDKRHST